MKKEKSVSYAEFESVQVRHERTVKRFIIAFIILAILFFEYMEFIDKMKRY